MHPADFPIATFSIVARDPATGDLGVAVASKFLSVGAVVPAAIAGVGAVATQAHANTTYGSRTLEMLGRGASVQEIASHFADTDEGFAVRQFGIVAADGSSITHTGADCHDWAGGVAGDGFAAQGNILTGPEVVDALVTGIARTDVPFPERLVAALRAADEAGGDSRGRQSAALLVVGEAKGYGGFTDRWIDLRVDDHAAPIPELARLLELHQLFLTRPSDEPRALDDADIRWLQGVLAEGGHLAQAPDGTWNDATEEALRTLYSMENLEERWLGGRQVDPVAWRHLKLLFHRGGGSP